MGTQCRQDITYTDVVVIGNGPSGITMSYLLAGNWPYYSGGALSDPHLQFRLEQEPNTSLVEQDLQMLCSGLEGRSSNPVALLFDALAHPDADMGVESPSQLTWKSQREKEIPHVVLGRCAEGGAWQMMEADMQTLSLGSWMELPDMPFWEWMGNREHADSESRLPSVVTRRASMNEVRAYYTDYLEKHNLGKYFNNHCTVTSVERVLDVHHSVDEESGEQTPCSRNHCDKLKWEVRGYRTVSTPEVSTVDTVDFCYRAPSVVLATGSFDLPNQLGVPGEQQPYVLHSLNELNHILREGRLTSDSDPLLVIGAGLTAADALHLAGQDDIPMFHVFRKDGGDPDVVFNKLPSTIYPEYHRIHSLMKQGEASSTYQAFPMHQIVEFKDDGKVLVRAKNSCDTLIQVSYALVLVGSEPDLSFLPEDGKQLGIVPDMRINSKSNPVDVDLFSYQSVHKCGLYAMGPLVKDTFVRFLTGGALGIASHMWMKRCGKI